GLDVEDAAAPAHQGAGAAGFAGLLRREFGKVAAQRLGRAGAGAEQEDDGCQRNRAAGEGHRVHGGTPVMSGGAMAKLSGAFARDMILRDAEAAQLLLQASSRFRIQLQPSIAPGDETVAERADLLGGARQASCSPLAERLWWVAGTPAGAGFP